MGEVLLKWTYESDMIECPSYISDNIHEYVKQFDNWMYNKNNNHGYWAKDSFCNEVICFGSEVFVDWLNTNIIQQDEKLVEFVKRDFQATDEEMKLPHIYF